MSVTMRTSLQNRGISAMLQCTTHVREWQLPGGERHGFVIASASESIQLLNIRDWIASSPRDDTGCTRHTSASPRLHRPGCSRIALTEGAGNAWRQRTRSLVCKSEK